MCNLLLLNDTRKIQRLPVRGKVNKFCSGVNGTDHLHAVEPGCQVIKGGTQKGGTYMVLAFG